MEINESKSIQKSLEDLFPLNRSLTGDPNRETLSYLKEIIPLNIVEYPSKQKVFDWEIPYEWKVNEAYVEDSNGEKVIDFRNNNLHLVGYSRPFKGKLNFDELSEKLHYLDNLEDAIPYRTTYYNDNWGFCLSKKDYDLLDRNIDYNIVVDTVLFEGNLTIGEYVIKGKSEKEILISSYICHPSMANDSLSGVILSAYLAKYLSQSNNYYTYRFVFVPETIGAIAYCFNNKDIISKIDLGLVITTVGGKGKIGYKQSYNSDCILNQLVKDTLIENNYEVIEYPFDISGSDERQYSTPGFRVNCISITKDKYYEYPYYHTSHDNLDFVNGAQINETLNLYKKLVEKIDNLRYYKNNVYFGEVMLSKHDLYPKLGGALNFSSNKNKLSEIEIINWILFYSDGKTSIQEILSNIGLKSSSDIDAVLKKLIDKNILLEL